MGDTPGSPTISMKLQSIAAQARRYPEMVFNNVFHLIDRDFLREAYRRTRKDSAPGVDKVTAKQYAENLDENLRDLHERLRANRYVAPPVERVWIGKEGGKKRPAPGGRPREGRLEKARGRPYYIKGEVRVYAMCATSPTRLTKEGERHERVSCRYAGQLDPAARRLHGICARPHDELFCHQCRGRGWRESRGPGRRRCSLANAR